MSEGKKTIDYLSGDKHLACLRADPAIEPLLSRMPEQVAESFTIEQLISLKAQLSSRKWGKHRIDLRSTVSFFSYRYYYVFVAGRNRRELSRAEKRLGLMIHSALVTGFLTFSCLFGLLVLYLVKSAMGIDLFPGFSLGIWGWFKSSFLAG